MSTSNGKGFISWGTGLVIAIVLFMSGTLGFVFYATTFDFDLVTDHHYEEGVKYQEVIDRVEQTQQLSVPVQFRYDRNNQELGITFPDDVKEAPKSGILTLYRPDNADLDQQKSLSNITQNALSVQDITLTPGQWKIKLEWSADTINYYSESALFIE